MRITAVLERPVRLHGRPQGGPANAVVDFSGHTVSLVAVIADRDGKRIVGVAFDSIGRFAQSGILRDRMIRRVLAAPPDALLDDSGRMTRPRFWCARSPTKSQAATATGRPRPPPWSWRAGT
jgi:hypothetical protein